MLENKTFFKALSRCSAVNVPQEVKRRYNGINRQTPQGFFSAETGQQEYLFHSYFQIYIYRDFWLYIYTKQQKHISRDGGTMRSNRSVGGDLGNRARYFKLSLKITVKHVCRKCNSCNKPFTQ